MGWSFYAISTAILLLPWYIILLLLFYCSALWSTVVVFKLDLNGFVIIVLGAMVAAFWRTLLHLIILQFVRLYTFSTATNIYETLEAVFIPTLALYQECSVLININKTTSLTQQGIWCTKNTELSGKKLNLAQLLLHHPATCYISQSNTCKCIPDRLRYKMKGVFLLLILQLLSTDICSVLACLRIGTGLEATMNGLKQHIHTLNAV